MTLDISLVSTPELHDFQQLLAAKLPQLFPDIPADRQLTQIDGAVYILLEDGTGAHIIAADPRDGSRAVFAALACVDHYKLSPDTRMTLLSPYRSPAVRWLCQQAGALWQRILIVSSDGEKGLLIDTAFTTRKSMEPEPTPPGTLTRPAEGAPPPHAGETEAEPANIARPGVSTPLSEEEEAFFQHL